MVQILDRFPRPSWPRSALTLLVARVPLADDPDNASTPDHLAVLADRLYARSYLHGTHPRSLITEL